MAFNKKEWTNRIAEYINRRLLTKEDGSTELVTVAREEGNVSQEGDAFNADNMNDLEERIADEFENINNSLNAKPNWKNNYKLSNAVPQTLGKDCYMCFKYRGASEKSYTEVQLDDNTIWSGNLESNGTYFGCTPFFYVPKGTKMVVDTSGTVYESFFYIVDVI